MKRIIIVEDDPAILETMEMVFSPAYQVLSYRSAEPLMTTDFDRPDLFIIDKQLSGTSGIVLCAYLKNRDDTRSIPVIMMSASPDIHKVAMEVGANDAIEKPFAIKALRAIAAKYTSHREM